MSLSSSVHPADAAAPPPGWDRLVRWVRFYSLFLLITPVVTIFFAHLFIVMGSHWETCADPVLETTNWRCVGIYHLLEVPLTLLFFYTVWYGLRRFSYETLPRYFYLVVFQTCMMSGFAILESVVLVRGFDQNLPQFQSDILTLGTMLLTATTVLGFYTFFVRLMPFFLLDHGRSGAAPAGLVNGVGEQDAKQP